MTYKQLNRSGQAQSVTKVNPDGSLTSFPALPDNPYYQIYLEWLKDGNTPEIIDLDLPAPPPGPSVEERLEAAEALIDMMLEAGGEASNG